MEYIAAAVYRFTEVYWNLSLSTYSLNIYPISLRRHTVTVRWDIYDPKKKMDLFIHSVTPSVHRLPTEACKQIYFSRWKGAQELLGEQPSVPDTFLDFYIWLVWLKNSLNTRF